MADDDGHDVAPGELAAVFDLTRQVVDAANPATDEIAMRAMRDAWKRQRGGPDA